MKDTRKKDFITAYMATFGTTKKEAVKTYSDCIKGGNVGYISAIVEGFKNQAKKAFYND